MLILEYAHSGGTTSLYFEEMKRFYNDVQLAMIDWSAMSVEVHVSPRKVFSVQQ